MVSADYQKRIA